MKNPSQSALALLLPLILLAPLFAGARHSRRSALAAQSSNARTPKLATTPASTASPTFYRDVLPIVQQHCQGCHRPGEIGPFPLETYRQVGERAAA
ncbi:MAG: hypothetical protein WBZ32_15330, partial [Candidatus Acidiferrales bacterium]